MNPAEPRYDGNKVPALAAAALVGGTFVKQTGSNTQGGEYSVTTCALGDKPFGVTLRDVTSGQLGYDGNAVEQRTTVIRKPAIARVVPGATISGPGIALQSDAQGRAIPWPGNTKGTLATGVVGSNNAITWTAVDGGTPGNDITVQLINPGTNTASTSVAVTGEAIAVTLSYAASAITATAAQVIAAIGASSAASALVTATNTSTSTGAGVVAAVAATNLAGGADEAGGGHIAGYSCCAAGSSDAFVEVALD